jgi:predicted O-linked N-acetylglucosamine transferase (SPINDLY family)
MELRPGYLMANSNLLMCEQYRSGVTPARLLELHAEWDERHVRRDDPAWANPRWDLVRDPERPVRVGFVSPDLRRHPVGFFLVRALEHLDPDAFEVVCYSSRVEEDDYTARLRAASKEWRVTLGMTNDELARQVRDDRVDIAFDLMGHTSHHRLLAFARRLAPIQMTWIGYVGTTGLREMDYLIADRHHVPPGDEPHYRESILRLPDGYVCFDPPAEAPEVGPLPATGRGYVTFGCFNNVSKLTTELLEAWAEILRRVPNSRLLLVSPGLNGSIARSRVVETLTSAGVYPAQLEIRGALSRPEIFDAYNAIDVALDTFPYSGGLTTCEALWMGVPVVTCPGESFAGRHSLSHLTNVGLTEAIAADRREYVEIAVRMADDLDGLAALRAGLRDQMAHSPLCDGPRFGENLGALLRDVWRDWCGRAV